MIRGIVPGLYFAAGIFAAILPLAAGAVESNPILGRWRTIDDEAGGERSIVEISLVDGELQGRIVEIFYRPDEKPDPVCEACQDSRRNQPVIGMVFLWGLKPDGGDWVGGSVLDPKNGKTYSAKINLIEDGKKLRLRGYIGTPLLGRTQIWHRER